MRAHEPITNLTRPAWRRVVLIVLGVCALAIPATAGAAQQSTSAEAVRDWNLYAANALGNPPTAPVMPGVGQAPQVSVLHVGMVQGAVYDAVNAIDGGHQPYLAGLPPASPSASKAAAAATAAYKVLVGLQQAGAPMLPPAVRDWLDPAYAESLAAIPEDVNKQDGIAAGSAAAAAMLAARADDGRFDPFAVVEGTDPGEWRKTPPNFGGDPGAWVGNVDPFLVPSVEMLRTDGPNALTSAAYAEDFNEVKELGSLDEHEPHRRPDGSRDLLAGQRHLDLEPRLPRAGGERGAGRRRERPPARDDQPGRGRRLDRLLERQVLLELLAADHRDPRGR